MEKLVVDGLAGRLGPDRLLAQILFPEEDSIVEAIDWRLPAVENRVGDFEGLREAEPDKLLDPLNKWILEV